MVQYKLFLTLITGLGNRIASAGFQCIAEALKINTSLTEINFNGNMLESISGN